MEKQRNSECWYVSTCNEDCDTCTTFIQLDWQMKNSGLPASKQKIITLYVNENNACDKSAYQQLALIKKDVVNYVQSGKNLYICGELLDADGDCGGYNLHFAFGSGMIVGKSVK